MNSLDGIIAANRHAEKQQAVNRATNKSSKGKPAASLKRTLPKRDKAGRLAY